MTDYDNRLRGVLWAKDEKYDEGQSDYSGRFTDDENNSLRTELFNASNVSLHIDGYPEIILEQTDSRPTYSYPDFRGSGTHATHGNFRVSLWVTTEYRSDRSPDLTFQVSFNQADGGGNHDGEAMPVNRLESVPVDGGAVDPPGSVGDDDLPF